MPKLLTSSTNRKQELTLSSCVSLIETTHIPSHVLAASPESNSFSALQDAEFPEPNYVPGFHVTALVSSEVRVALAPMPATSTHSHAPTMSTHASLSATPSLVSKCISPGHAARVDHYPASPQGHNPSQPQS